MVLGDWNVKPSFFFVRHYACILEVLLQLSNNNITFFTDRLRWHIMFTFLNACAGLVVF